MIFVTSSELPGVGIEELAQSREVVVWGEQRSPRPDEVAELAHNAEGVICTSADTVNAAFLDAVPNVRAVSTVSAGIDHLDLDELARRGIHTFNTPGVVEEAVADLTMGLIIAAARHIVVADRFVRSGDWVRAEWERFLGLELRGATLGLIGYGGIGSRVAQRASAFGMNILYSTRSPIDGAIGTRTGFGELLTASDIVSIHVPLTQETWGLIGSSELQTMKDDALLVNTSRGPVVDEAALIEALGSGEIGGAALDVMQVEPLPSGSPLLSAPNLILTPHYGSATVQARHGMVRMAIENLIGGLAGETEASLTGGGSNG